MPSLHPKNIDEYIRSAPEPSREKLLELRKIIKELIPEAEEAIGYGMPVMKLKGQSVIGFAGYNQHIGFYPMSGSFLNAYEKDLKNYVTSKGGVQFPLEKSLPLGLIKKLVKGKIKMIEKSEKE